MSASSDSNKPNGFAASVAALIETSTVIAAETATAAVTGAVTKSAPRDIATVSAKASAKNVVRGAVVDAFGPTPYYRAMTRFFARFTREAQAPLAEQI